MSDSLFYGMSPEDFVAAASPWVPSTKEEADRQPHFGLDRSKVPHRFTEAFDPSECLEEYMLDAEERALIEAHRASKVAK